MTKEEFFRKCEWEGLSYTVTDYFTEKELAEIDDPTVRKLALQARKYMLPLMEAFEQWDSLREDQVDA